MKKSLLRFAVLAIIVMLSLPVMAGAESDSSWINRKRKEIGRSLVEINAGNWTSLLQYYADDIEYSDPIVHIEGIGTMTEFLGRLFASGPDLITTVEDETCINGIYSATWTMAGSLEGVPYYASGMSIIKFRPKSLKAYYAKDYYSEGDIMASIPGLDEAIGAFRVFYRCVVDPTFDCPLSTSMDRAAPEDKTPSTEDAPFATVPGLQQNIPNPFNPHTTISFEVPDGGAEISLRIYDVSGRLVRTLIDGHEPSGARTATWDGRNDEGKSMASGIYYYRMTMPEFSEQKKMILLR